MLRRGNIYKVKNCDNADFNNRQNTTDSEEVTANFHKKRFFSPIIITFVTNIMNMSRIYDYKAIMSNGQVLDFSQFRGKVLLIVNTASKCGFTPQFAGLEELNQKYKDKGLVVIGFPCNQFAHQDPGTDSEISSFCQLNYGVTFQMMKKIDVNGENAHPIFKYLTSETRGFLGKRIKWNFTKFLISRDGTKIKRYPPTKAPIKIEKDIEALI